MKVEQKGTPSGKRYLESGSQHNMTLLFLSGQGEVGQGYVKQRIAGPLKSNVTGGDKLKWPEIENYPLRIIYPIGTNRSRWEIFDIDSFLDEIDIPGPVILSGWSLGGGGVLRYGCQVKKKHKIAGYISVAGFYPEQKGFENLDAPLRLYYSLEDVVVKYVDHVKPTIERLTTAGADFEAISMPGAHWVIDSVSNPVNGLYDWIVNLNGKPEPDKPGIYIDDKFFCANKSIKIEFKP